MSGQSINNRDMDLLDLAYPRLSDPGSVENGHSISGSDPRIDNRLNMFSFQSYDRQGSYPQYPDLFVSPLDSAMAPNNYDTLATPHNNFHSDPSAFAPLARSARTSRTSIATNPEWDDDDDAEHYSRTTGKPKLAHNVIEQRYRNKINDKFTALQQSVPTLRVATRRRKVSEDEEDEYGDDDVSYQQENLEGLEPARKLNKGTILAKSVEYIKFLERKNAALKSEYVNLAERARVMGLIVNDIDTRLPLQSL